MMLTYAVALFGYHLDDAWSTHVGIIKGKAKEANPLPVWLRSGTGVRLFVYKIVLATLILSLCSLLPFGWYLEFGDILLEGSVVAWNTYLVLEKRRQK
ncbi:hypothetical protein [Sulfuracidifex metallicus]|uniref:hypothetical protein n=1 Tax=Sulfuracidifex metallicus TaxID=47303 RepID=UPI0006CF4D68|nr:hypothetical protein [Sulfuracidifex metallicus]